MRIRGWCVCVCVRNLGVCSWYMWSWCVQLVCEAGVCSWCVQLMCAAGVWGWCVQPVCAVGVCSWCMHLVHAADVCAACVCAAGVLINKHYQRSVSFISTTLLLYFRYFISASLFLLLYFWCSVRKWNNKSVTMTLNDYFYTGYWFFALYTFKVNYLIASGNPFRWTLTTI